jgi:hypothetical protein
MAQKNFLIILALRAKNERPPPEQPELRTPKSWKGTKKIPFHVSLYSLCGGKKSSVLEEWITAGLPVFYLEIYKA